MKLAVSSSCVSDALDRGDLTQLEFIDNAARVVRCDGVTLDVRHFPRSDGDYLAQIKKMATDLGLCIVALESHDFFTADEGTMRAQIDMALAVGAPLLCASLAAETASSWSDQLARIGTASGLAKSANVTLAVRNAPGTFAASAHDCKRLTKEADSAWLRLALDPNAFDAASDWTPLLGNAVIAFDEHDREPDAGRWDGAVGWVVVKNEAMRGWRIARSKLELNRT
jgi:sugar phosphate isomerase/epimerase